jgi:MFS family permease
MPVATTVRDYVAAVRAFSVPARRLLLTSFLTWAGHGISQVLFNLYLVELGHREAFVGQVVSVNGLGLALAAIPAGFLAERRGRRSTLVAGALLEGAGMLVRAVLPSPAWILGGSFAAGVGQSLLAVAAAPFLTEHSTTRERTHLFSAYFALILLAAVAGSAIGGFAPAALAHAGPLADDLRSRYRIALVAGSLLPFAAALPLAALRPLRELPHGEEPAAGARATRDVLVPLGVNAFLIGAGAGLVIPFMNLYFAQRFACSSAQIGAFFASAQILTACAAMLGPTFAQRWGKLRVAVAFQLLSLPFLVTLGAERHLELAVVAFWLRATFMQAAQPLQGAFVMEALPAGLRARSMSLTNTVWNIGWAASATGSGWVIQHFGYAVPFYLTAALYAAAAAVFWMAFRHLREERVAPATLARELADEASARGEGPGVE